MGKKTLALTTALTSVWSAAAFAQSTPSANAPTGSATDSANAAASSAETARGDIVVTGIRRANAAAIEAKRSATNIIDVIGSTEVRALPDNTIVEAVRRIPGVSILPQGDNEHPQDEAVTPIIRGLGPAYNNVTIDGLAIASPGTPNGTIGNIARGVRLDILPASMVSQLQVVKSFTADLDPNAVGGAINLVTRSAFEGGGKPFFTMEAALGHATDVSLPRPQSDPGYRIVATGSTTFGPDHMFGLTLSGNYQRLSTYSVEHATADTIFYNFFDNAGALQTGAALGNGYAVPQEDRYWYNQNDRSRYGVTGKLEAHLASNLDAYVSGGYYYFKDHYQRNEDYITWRGVTSVQNQTPTSGSFARALLQIGYIDDNIVSKTRLGQAGLTWRPDDRQVLSLRGSASYATYDEDYSMYKYGTGVTQANPSGGGISQAPTANYAFTYDTSKFDQRFNISRSEYYNLANYGLIYYRPSLHRIANDQIYTGRLDYAFNRAPADRGFGFAAGASYTEDRPEYRSSLITFQPNTNGPVVTLAGASGPGGAPLTYSNGLNLLTIDKAAFLAQFNSLPANAVNQIDQTIFNNQDNFTHVEKTFGGYALVSYKTDDFAAEAGLHLDSTKQSTVGRLVQAGVFRDVPTNSSYSYLLPSAIATWHATRALDVRAAFSQTIGRPSYDSYAARSSVVFALASDQGNPNAANVTVNVGNPDLRPRKSSNFDVSFDWVPSREFGGLVSIAAFYKDISNEIYVANSTGFAYQGVNYVNAAVSKPVNASSSSIRGVELNSVINSLGFIHPAIAGFGASANLALLDGRVDVPMTIGGTRRISNLVGQPNYTINASVFYARDGLELRAAYNRQGRALRAIQNNIYWQDLYWAPRSQIDLSASYTLKNGAAVFAQAANVTNARTISLTGPNRDLLRNAYSVPTTFWLGIRFTPRLP